MEFKEIIIINWMKKKNYKMKRFWMEKDKKKNKKVIAIASASGVRQNSIC